jgi:hypothetical protein
MVKPSYRCHQPGHMAAKPWAQELCPVIWLPDNGAGPAMALAQLTAVVSKCQCEGLVCVSCVCIIEVSLPLNTTE